MESEESYRQAELMRRLVLEFNRKQLKSGCYAVKDLKSYSMAVPLKHMDYRILIVGSVAQVTLSQQYENPLDVLLEMEYVFPIEPSACVTNFKATFQDYDVVGVVKEKQQAQEEYEEALQGGHMAAYGQLRDESKDIMQIKIGNVPARSKVTVLIEFMQPLEVSMNTFWRLSIQSHVWPRYLNGTKGKQMKDCRHPFTWSFKIELQTARKCVHASSPSHSLKELYRDEQSTKLVLVMPESELPTGDFVFLHTVENFEKATLLRGKTDTSQSCLISFIPRFNEQLSLNDAEQMERENRQCQPNLDRVAGQYIFLLDRSGSMEGTRIDKAKEALTCFVRSLPKDSYFNIVSFGSDYECLYRNSEKYNDKHMKSAVKSIQKFAADRGGTEIAKPLKQVLQTSPIKGYPRHVFLLTDGQVSDTQSIVNLVGQNNKYCRVHGIGIGDGASKALLKGCANKGKGKTIFLADNENVAGKVIELLQATMSPAITLFNFDFDKGVVESIVPNPKEMPYILKNEPVNIYVFLKPGFEGSTKFILSYQQPSEKQLHRSEAVLLGNQPSYPFIDRMGQHAKIQRICMAVQTNSPADILMNNVKDLLTYAVSESVRHQVLCPLTALVCIGKRLSDSTLQQYQTQRIQLGKDEQQQGRTGGAIKCCALPLKKARQSSGFDLGIGRGIKNVASKVSGFFGQLFKRGTETTEEVPKPSSSTLEDYQSSDGSWDEGSLNEVSKVTKVSKKVMSELAQSLKASLSLIVTLIAVHYLEKHRNTAENSLIIRKARDWLRKEAVQQGIDPQELTKAESRL